MALCNSAPYKKREEELLAKQAEQRRLLASQVVAHAAKVATANTNLLRGILETCAEGLGVPEEIPLAIISTMKAEVNAKRKAIAQSKINLQQRERMFSHPLNDNCSLMSVGELQKWRGVHRRLAAVEGRRLKELEKEIVRVALGRELGEAGGEDLFEDQTRSAGTAEEMSRMAQNTEDEDVSTDIEMESTNNYEEKAVDNQKMGKPGKEVQSLKGAVNMQGKSSPKDNMISDMEVEKTEEEEVVEVGAEVLGGAEDSVKAQGLGVSETIPSPAQTLQLVNNVKSSALLCKDCSKTFSTAELLLAHAMTKHWVNGSCRQHCPSRGCNYIAMRGGYGMGKLQNHMKEKHTLSGSSILQRYVV